jgi:hypothetical protein
MDVQSDGSGAVQVANGTAPPAGVSRILATLPDKHSDLIRRAYKAGGGRYSVWEESDKLALLEAIFKVEDDLEHKQVAQPPSGRHEVHVLHKARLQVEHDLGWDNE